MYFINFRKNNLLSLSIIIVVLLSIFSMGFAKPIGVAADSSRNHRDETGQFGFLSKNPATSNFLTAETSNLEYGHGLNQTERIFDSSVFDKFDNWVKSYVANDYRADSRQAAAGEDLALERRELLKQLIKDNPQAALEKALSAETLERLPDFVTKHTEKRISATGDFFVYVSDGKNHASGGAERRAKAPGSRTERSVVIGDSRYRASVYGRRETMTTKLNIPLQGIAIDDVMAVEESPARILDKSAATAEIGGRQVYFADGSEMENFIAEQIEWESKIGPARPTSLGGKANSTTNKYAPDAALAWTLGAKKVLVIRVDFSDKPGEPLDDAGNPFTLTRAQNLYSQVNQFFVNNSYNQTSLQTTVVPEVVRLPQTLSYYIGQYIQSGGFDEMIAHARAAVQTKGYDNSIYDFDVVAFTKTSLPGSLVALSTVGGKGSVLTGEALYLSEAAHELGHNYGLTHANLWRTTDGTSVGPGYNVEYGDCYDMMAACTSINQNSHFNARYKRWLDWLTEENVKTVTENIRTYTLYAQDATTNTGIRALKINRDGSAKNFWVEYRRLTATNGVLVRWDTGQDQRETQLLDMNPATSSISDAALAVGQEFLDKENGIKISVASGDTADSLKVTVQLNLPVDCTYSLSPASVDGIVKIGGTATTQITTNKPGCSWTAVSNDYWLTVNGGNSGPGNRAISVSVASNSGSERTGTVSIIAGGVVVKIFSVTQYTGSCADSVNLVSSSVPASGGTLSYTSGECSVTPTSAGTSDWIDITTNPITVLPNSGGARTGTLVLTIQDSNGQLITKSLNVHQAGQTVNCTFSINAASSPHTVSGGSGSFNLQTGAGCSWAATSNDSWISVTSNSSGSGNGTVVYSVAANPGVARTGTITAGGQTFTVNQSAGKLRKRARFF